MDFLKQRPIMIGAIILAVVVVFTLLATIISGLSGGTSSTERLAVRLTSTENTANSATANLKSSKLRALNSDLKLYLTNTIRDFGPILTTNKIDVKSPNEKIASAESNTKMLAVLEDARLNAIYDRAYAREMAYQLGTVLTLMRQLKADTNSNSMSDFLDNSIKNLVPTQKQFADYNAANS